VLTSKRFHVDCTLVVVTRETNLLAPFAVKTHCIIIARLPNMIVEPLVLLALCAAYTMQTSAAAATYSQPSFGWASRRWSRQESHKRHRHRQHVNEAWRRLYTSFVYYYERPAVSLAVVLDETEPLERRAMHGAVDHCAEQAIQDKQQCEKSLRLNAAAHEARRRLGNIAQPSSHKSRRFQ